MSTYEKYIETMKILRKSGFLERASIIDIKNTLLRSGISARENYQLKFHMQNMMSLGFIKDTGAGNVFKLDYTELNEYERKKDL